MYCFTFEKSCQIFSQGKQRNLGWRTSMELFKNENACVHFSSHLTSKLKHSTFLASQTETAFISSHIQSRLQILQYHTKIHLTPLLNIREFLKSTCYRQRVIESTFSMSLKRLERVCSVFIIMSGYQNLMMCYILVYEMYTAFSKQNFKLK